MNRDLIVLLRQLKDAQVRSFKHLLNIPCNRKDKIVKHFAYYSIKKQVKVFPLVKEVCGKKRRYWSSHAILKAAL